MSEIHFLLAEFNFTNMSLLWQKTECQYWQKASFCRSFCLYSDYIVHSVCSQRSETSDSEACRPWSYGGASKGNVPYGEEDHNDEKGHRPRWAYCTVSVQCRGKYNSRFLLSQVVSLHRSTDVHNAYNLFILTIDYSSKNFTTISLLAIERMAIFVVKSIVIQMNGQGYGSIVWWLTQTPYSF